VMVSKVVLSRTLVRVTSMEAVHRIPENVHGMEQALMWIVHAKTVLSVMVVIVMTSMNVPPTVEDATDIRTVSILQANSTALHVPSFGLVLVCLVARMRNAANTTVDAIP